MTIKDNQNTAVPVFWPDEYGQAGDDNGGLLFGIYYLDDDGEILDAEWFATAHERDAELTAVSQDD